MSANVLRDHLIWGMEHSFDEGKGIEAHSLLDALEGLTLEQLAWIAPDGGPSIWAIVIHTLDWAETILKWARGQNAQYSDLWPEPDVVNEKSWGQTLEHLKHIQSELIRHLESLNDADLKQQVSSTSSENFTLEMAYAGLVVHAGYHTGQIVKLKQLQGIEI